MTSVSAQEVKELRDRTGAGMMDCKHALEEADGDLEEAIDILRTRGEAKAAKRAGREATEGRIESYIHFGGRIGVIVELNCETDFVAKTDDFEELARNLAMHIAATDPVAVSEEDIPEEVVEREKKIYRDQAAAEGKPEEIQEKIVEGRLRKFYEENVLLNQEYVKDTDITIDELVTRISAKTGEKIVVRRFERFEVGGFQDEE